MLAAANGKPFQAVAFPDDGAAKRFSNFFTECGFEIIICNKIRAGDKRIIEITKDTFSILLILLVLPPTPLRLMETHRGPGLATALAAHEEYQASVVWAKGALAMLGNVGASVMIISINKTLMSAAPKGLGFSFVVTVGCIVYYHTTNTTTTNPPPLLPLPPTAECAALPRDRRILSFHVAPR